MPLELHMREGQNARLGFRYYQGGKALPFEPGSIAWSSAAPSLQLTPGPDGTTCAIAAFPGEGGTHIVNVVGKVNDGSGSREVSDWAQVTVTPRAQDGSEIVLAEAVRDLPPAPIATPG